jgi:predicted HTH transcriptional regulator
LTINLQKNYDLKALFGIMCSRNMNEISLLRDKTVRVIVYKGTDKLDAISDREGARGYTTSFETLMVYLMDRIPHDEIMKHGVRTTVYKIPEPTIREFVANAIIHQDFTQAGGRPIVEFYSDKVRVINPGEPLIEPDRFIDSPSKSRNPSFAKLMRAAGLCEQRGSGVDRALREIERASLPPPLIQAVEGSTIVTIFMNKRFAQLTADDRVRACYQHACLRYEAGDPMSNASLRARFGLGEKQYPQVSEVISNAIAAGRVRPLNEGQGNRVARYVPYWA